MFPLLAAADAAGARGNSNFGDLRAEFA